MKKRTSKPISYVSLFILVTAVSLFIFITYLFISWLMSLVPQVGIFGFLISNLVLGIGAFMMYSVYLSAKEVYEKQVKR
jgi:hypothetical protein|nr:MAG TPA: hypothetical protein [Caudoviricetes sp.]